MQLRLRAYLSTCPKNWQRFVQEINVNNDAAGEILVDQVLKDQYNAVVLEDPFQLVFDREEDYLLWILRYGTD